MECLETYHICRTKGLPWTVLGKLTSRSKMQSTRLICLLGKCSWRLSKQISCYSSKDNCHVIFRMPSFIFQLHSQRGQYLSNQLRSFYVSLRSCTNCLHSSRKFFWNMALETLKFSWSLLIRFLLQKVFFNPLRLKGIWQHISVKHIVQALCPVHLCHSKSQEQSHNQHARLHWLLLWFSNCFCRRDILSFRHLEIWQQMMHSITRLVVDMVSLERHCRQWRTWRIQTSRGV